MWIWQSGFESHEFHRIISSVSLGKTLKSNNLNRWMGTLTGWSCISWGYPPSTLKNHRNLFDSKSRTICPDSCVSLLHSFAPWSLLVMPEKGVLQYKKNKGHDFDGLGRGSLHKATNQTAKLYTWWHLRRTVFQVSLYILWKPSDSRGWVNYDPRGIIWTIVLDILNTFSINTINSYPAR